MIRECVTWALSIYWRKIAIIFLSISLNMCFGCSKEPSHRDGSFEYPQHMFWWKNKKTNFQLRTLIWESGTCLYCRLFKYNSFKKEVWSVNCLDPDQARHFVWSDLGPNSMQNVISMQKKLTIECKGIQRKRKYPNLCPFELSIYLADGYVIT